MQQKAGFRGSSRDKREYDVTWHTIRAYRMYFWEFYFWSAGVYR